MPTGITGTRQTAAKIIFIEIKLTFFVQNVNRARPTKKNDPIAEIFIIKRYLWNLFKMKPATIELNTPTKIILEPKTEMSTDVKPTGENN